MELGFLASADGNTATTINSHAVVLEIEPTSEAWEASVLPLNYAHSGDLNSTHDGALGTRSSFMK
jgi:hypothetical protein